MSKSSLSSVVSDLVRAQMGTSVSSTVTNDDLDRHVAELILKEAKQKAKQYSQEGIRAYLARNLDPNAPKPNKRFLSSIIRSTDDHNKAILRTQALAAQEVRLEREEQDRRERRKRAEEAVAAERARRRRGEEGTEWAHNWDRRGSRSDRKRRDRSPDWRDEHMSDEGYEPERGSERRERRSERRRSRDRSGERRRSKREEGSSRRPQSPEDEDRQQRRHRRHRHRSRSRDVNEDEDRHRRKRRRRSPSTSDSLRDRSPSPRERRSRKHRSRRSPSAASDDAAREPGPSHTTSGEEAPDALSREDELRSRLREKGKGKAREPEPRSSRTTSRSRSPPRKSKRRASPAPSPSKSGSSSSRTLRPSRSPSPGPPPPPQPTTSPPPLPSKMDKYFESSYDPRLDVAPLAAPRVPKTGMIDDAEFAGWDAMLELIRQRREDKEEKKRLERWGVSKEKDKSEMTAAAEGPNVMDLKYKKRGSVREWDLGKEGF